MNDSKLWRPSASVEVLKIRAKLLKTVRNFFDSRDYIEVQTPIISRDTAIDRWLEPIKAITGFETAASYNGGENSKSEIPRRGDAFFLQTSPEFAMKRLLAAGSPSIYQICPAFRQGEVGRRHNPEFTIVEWYGLNDDFQAGMRLLGDLCNALLFPEYKRKCNFVSYRDAFIEFTSLDPFNATMTQIHNYCQQEKIEIPDGFDPADRDSWLDVILSEKVQVNLGFSQCANVDTGKADLEPVILYHYPASQAALSKVVEENYGAVSQRFELFVGGLELANGYHELADGDELRRRHEQTNKLRLADGHAPLPEDALLIDALKAGFPPCTGCAMGFDRIVMLAAGVSDIAKSMAFDWSRA